jgi:hypothetical protein
MPASPVGDVNELDDYLSLAIEKVSDPIAWWWDHQKAYPKLSAMAFDYLSVPGNFHLLCISQDFANKGFQQHLQLLSVFSHKVGNYFTLLVTAFLHL